jgi:hypothetical protein
VRIGYPAIVDPAQLRRRVAARISERTTSDRTNQSGISHYNRGRDAFTLTKACRSASAHPLVGAFAGSLFPDTA